jgi:hypothetical protein
MFRLRGLQLTPVPDIALLWPLVGEKKFFRFDFQGRLIILTFFGSTSNLVQSLNQALCHHFSYRGISILGYTFRTGPNNEFCARVLSHAEQLENVILSISNMDALIWPGQQSS